GNLLRLVEELPAHDRRGCAAGGRAPGPEGAEAVGAVVGVAVVDDDIGGRDPELVAHDLGEGRLVALPLALDPELEDGLPGGHDGELRRVEHLDAQQVVVLARAGPGDLGEARHPDADEPAPAAALLLLLAELLVAGLLESEVEGGAVVAGVVGEAGGGA